MPHKGKRPRRAAKRRHRHVIGPCCCHVGAPGSCAGPEAVSAACRGAFAVSAVPSRDATYVFYLNAAVPTLSARRETIAWFRDEFERTRHETQTDKVDSLLKHGRILLKQTESGFMLSGTGEPFVKLRGGRT